MSLMCLTVATEILDVLEDLRWPKGKAGNSTQALQALTLLGHKASLQLQTGSLLSWVSVVTEAGFFPQNVSEHSYVFFYGS